MSGTRESVIRMANQIARNFAVHGDARAIEETAAHIRLFWDPRMKKQAFELLHEPDCGLSGQARAALSQLANEADNRAA
ncbi:MAG: formate dehydrogenase subunit delta [Erythrobacter sp.]